MVSVAAAPASPYGHLNLSVSITGTFDAVSKTVGAIEYQPYNTSLTSLSLSTTANPGDTGTTTATTSQPVWNAAVVFSVGAITTVATSTVATSTTP